MANQNLQTWKHFASWSRPILDFLFAEKIDCAQNLHSYQLADGGQTIQQWIIAVKIFHREGPAEVMGNSNQTFRVKISEGELHSTIAEKDILPYSRVVYTDDWVLLIWSLELKVDWCQIDGRQITKIFTTSSLGVKAILIFGDIIMLLSSQHSQ